MSKESFAKWLAEQESYYIRSDVLHEAEERHSVHVEYGPITVTPNDDGTTNIPHRDIRHADWSDKE